MQSKLKYLFAFGTALCAMAACSKHAPTPTPAATSAAPAASSASVSDDDSAVASLVVSDPRNQATADTIRSGVRAQLPTIRACYATELAQDPKAAGTVTAEFDIAPGGIVSAASATGMSDALNGCVAATIKQITFALDNDAPVHIKSYPFAFAPGK